MAALLHCRCFALIWKQQMCHLVQNHQVEDLKENRLRMFEGV